MTSVVYPHLPPLRGIAAFCRYSRVGNLDVRGALIFEWTSYVEGSCFSGFRVYLTLFLVQNQAKYSYIKRYISQFGQALSLGFQLRRGVLLFGIQGGPHSVSCSESSIIKLYQALYQALSRGGSVGLALELPG